MKKIKYLQIVFKDDITESELPKFRGAVIDAATRENVLFHNHVDDNFRYAYPLIQYKRIGRSPAIVCLEQGTEAIHAFFSRPNASLQLGDRVVACQIDRLYLNEVTMQTWDKSFEYHIERWLAIKDENYRNYLALTTEAERKVMLEKLLIGNILSLAKGIGWTVTAPIEVKIQHVEREHKILYKGTRLTAFDVTFRCNVSLPNFIGLGKSSAMGFGVVRKPLSNSPRREDF